MRGGRGPSPLRGALRWDLAVLALQVSCTALCLHSAMSTCFQLGLTSIRLTTLAAPVFMLLLLEGERTLSQTLRRERGKDWSLLSCQTPSPLTVRAATAGRAVQCCPLAPPYCCGFSLRLSLS